MSLSDALYCFPAFSDSTPDAGELKTLFLNLENEYGKIDCE
jgi:hypothetical protein